MSRTAYVRHDAVTVPKDVRPIPGFPGYVFSRRGEVFSYWRTLRNGPGTKGGSSVMVLCSTPKRVISRYRDDLRRVDLKHGNAKKTKSVELLLDEVFNERMR